jgi:hypothetical protein
MDDLELKLDEQLKGRKEKFGIKPKKRLSKWIKDGLIGAALLSLLGLMGLGEIPGLFLLVQLVAMMISVVLIPVGALCIPFATYSDCGMYIFLIAIIMTYPVTGFIIGSVSGLLIKKIKNRFYARPPADPAIVNYIG